MQTGQDDDHLHPPKLLDVVEAVIEHHRQADDHGSPADDDRGPYDAAEHELIEFVRNHRGVIDNLDVHIGRECHVIFAGGYDTVIRVWDARGGTRRLSLDEPAAGDWSC